VLTRESPAEVEELGVINSAEEGTLRFRAHVADGKWFGFFRKRGRGLLGGAY
jgi:hypothetical protein